MSIQNRFFVRALIAALMTLAVTFLACTRLDDLNNQYKVKSVVDGRWEDPRAENRPKGCGHCHPCTVEWGYHAAPRTDHRVGTRDWSD